MVHDRPGPLVDTGVPHVARIWNYWLGGVDAEAYAIVRRLLDALPSGSYLAMYDGTNVVHGEASDRIVEVWNASGDALLVLRTPEQIERFFDGLALVEPGVVPVTHWRPDASGEPEAVDAFGGVGRKP